ncbi:MAG: DUF6295 family protein [Nitrospiraceae bacterium]
MMCTTIVNQAVIDGSGKGPNGWFRVTGVNVSYDHPFHSPLEHAMNIDFVNESEGPGARVAVELSLESARHLVECIQAALAQAEAAGYQDELASAGP